MIINFFKLPNDILIRIYQFDSTYHEIYNKVLQQLYNSFFVRTLIMNEYLYDEYYDYEEDLIDFMDRLCIIKHTDMFSVFEFLDNDFTMYFEIHDTIESMININYNFSSCSDYIENKLNMSVYDCIREDHDIIKYMNKWILFSNYQLN
jgi:hypothetical protein